jgi:hypothetical protein
MRLDETQDETAARRQATRGPIVSAATVSRCALAARPPFDTSHGLFPGGVAMASRWFGWIRCWIPLAAVAAFAAALPCSLPAEELLGGHCNLAQGCNSSSWQPCQGPNIPCGQFMQCECNGAMAGACGATMSCNNFNVQCSPNKACFCSQNNMCVGR